MKKVESVLNGSLRVGKSRVFDTFPHIHFCLLSLILPKIFTIQRGEGNINARHPLVNALCKPLHSLNLTLPQTILGGA
jgi:hypothetical protein